MNTVNIEVILLLNQDNLDNLDKALSSLEPYITSSKLKYYSINDNDNYYSMALFFIGENCTKKVLIKELLNKLPYICFRIENTSIIFVKNYDDLKDLYDDEYDDALGDDKFKMDLLSEEERYSLVFKTCKDFTQNDNLGIKMINDQNELVIYPLKTNYILLYQDDYEYDIVNLDTGRTHMVNITVTFPNDYFNIYVLKNLEK